MSSTTARLLSVVGYDPAIVLRLPRGEARFFLFASVLSLLAAVVAGVSLGFGAWLAGAQGGAQGGAHGGAAVVAVVAIVLAPLAALFVLNLLRLHHAGSGYPLHLPLELIPAWRPAGAAVVVLFTLGVLMVQPLVLLVQKPVLDDDVAARVEAERLLRTTAIAGGADNDVARVVVVDGLIVRGRAAWDLHPLASSLWTLLFALVIAGPALLRRTQARVLQRYESERWITERMFVDDEWARSQDEITTLLAPLPTFTGALSAHYADPPYNTRPLVFGLDPDIVVEGRVKFSRNKQGEQPAPALPTTSLDPALVDALIPARAPAPVPTSSSSLSLSSSSSSSSSSMSMAAPAPVVPAPTRAPTTTLTAPTRAPLPTTPITPTAATSTQPTASGPAVLLSIVDVGGGTAAAARERVPAAFIARYLGRSVDDVERTLAAADGALPLHKVFPEWNKLPTILLQDAGFAVDHGLARVLAIIVERDVDQVTRRLRAAPRDKKLSGVFAPELARRLLNKTI